MALFDVIYYEGEQSHCGHYTSGVKVDNASFLISDVQILRQQNLQCSSKDINVPFILMRERMTNYLTASPVSLNSTAEAGPSSALIREIAETKILEIRKTQSNINYYSGRRKSRFKQSQVYGKVEVKIHKS